MPVSIDPVLVGEFEGDIEPGTTDGARDAFIKVNANEQNLKTAVDAAGTVEGTAVLSTGEGGGTKVLTEQGDGSSAWVEPAGGGTEFADDEFRIQDNADLTKELAFEVSGITTAITRTITAIDIDTQLADIDSSGQLRLDRGQTFGITTGIAFGDGNTGFYESADNVVQVLIGGSPVGTFASGITITGTAATSARLLNVTSSATIPVYSFSNGDANTGIGTPGSDKLSMIAGGVEAIRSTEAGGAIVNDLTGVATLITGLAIAGLPTPALGMIARITDGDAALAWGATAVNTGAGATPYMVWYNGTNWTIMGK